MLSSFSMLQLALLFAKCTSRFCVLRLLSARCVSRRFVRYQGGVS